jgi:hypothetical protein
MGDIHNRDDAGLVVDPVDHPVGAAPRTEPVVKYLVRLSATLTSVDHCW